MVKTLILMRHAKSSWDNAHLSDHERTLNAQGREATPKIAAWLAKCNWIPDRIIASDSQRTLETAELLCGYWNQPIVIDASSNLYHAPASTYLQVAAKAPENCSTILLLGHNPGISILAGQISAQIDHMPTASVAVLQVPVNSWADVTTVSLSRIKLLAFQTPKSL